MKCESLSAAMKRQTKTPARFKKISVNGYKEIRENKIITSSSKLVCAGHNKNETKKQKKIDLKFWMNKKKTMFTSTYVHLQNLSKHIY